METTSRLQTKKRAFTRTCAAICAIFCIAAASALAGPIQDAIDAADAGDIVSVAAGVHTEALTVKDGVTLVGEGPRRSVIQAPAGAETAVTMGKQAALIGLSVRGGKTTILSDRNFIGLFDCYIQGAETTGVRLIYGSAAIRNCAIAGGGSGSGILSLGANPIVADSTICNWKNGVMAWHKYQPVLRGNIIRDNEVGVLSGKDTPVLMEGNLFWNNAEADVKGCDYAPVPAKDEPDAETLRAAYRDADVEAYLDLMDATYVEQVAHHAVVTYTLGKELGQFQVATAFDWADFIVSASTRDTNITACEAADTDNGAPLPARTDTVSELPSVRVEGAKAAEREMGRYVMAGLYVHPASYVRASEGVRVFRRQTSFSHIRVVAPAGWTIVKCAPEGSIEQGTDGRWEAHITEVGLTDVEIHLEGPEQQ